ncbi:sigma-70 family RNA polymerase sigma factor [Pyxidicoccus fallax]|uniref:Sigma-70 family RNA polymerase sigma factor n=1 Tax=Pyxidicoccus fallax TaxID=394095 RepID=A0A848LTY6_9BACT|nr:sigma-70 family RNA polymerase sigma factor [Pyxidicoccus fallax]NMO21090.1 sigma-70 family RNA polymerase sigma factor [Pyxidicoccus fallax]NPC82525.1 sigma-70 family RNA polymerase sigma factor [Pyxidicoccus fallax]
MTSPETPGPLTALLLAHAPPERREALRTRSGLEALLEAHLARGREAWPTVTLGPEPFLRHLARHLPDAEGPADALGQLRAADLYLACACAEGEPQALELFERHVLQKVSARLGVPPGVSLDEVLQVARQRLLLGVAGSAPKIVEFSGRGSLAGWVRIVASRIAREPLGQNGHQELFSEPPEALERMLSRADPERDLLQAHSRHVLSESLQAALAELSERERALLRMHHLHGLTMDRIATMYGEPRSSVARHVAQARERLLKLTRRELASRLKLDRQELESLLGLVQSQLEISLHRLMA